MHLSFYLFIYFQYLPIIIIGVYNKTTINFRVKDLFGTCGLETLFFGTSVSIGKDGLGTSVSFSIQKLTVGHVSTPESRHVS
jgi:hypothetical protein